MSNVTLIIINSAAVTVRVKDECEILHVAGNATIKDLMH